MRLFEHMCIRDLPSPELAACANARASTEYEQLRCTAG